MSILDMVVGNFSTEYVQVVCSRFLFIPVHVFPALAQSQASGGLLRRVINDSDRRALHIRSE